MAGIAGFKSPEDARRNASASFLRRWIDNDTFTWLITEEILTEYKEVLRRLGVRRSLIGTIVNHLREEAELITVSRRTGLSPDPGDDPFLCCAEESNADFVITLNPRDFPQHLLRARIINPSDAIPMRAKRHIELTQRKKTRP